MHATKLDMKTPWSMHTAWNKSKFIKRVHKLANSCQTCLPKRATALQGEMICCMSSKGHTVKIEEKIIALEVVRSMKNILWPSRHQAGYRSSSIMIPFVPKAETLLCHADISERRTHTVQGNLPACGHLCEACGREPERVSGLLTSSHNDLWGSTEISATSELCFERFHLHVVHSEWYLVLHTASHTGLELKQVKILREVLSSCVSTWIEKEMLLAADLDTVSSILKCLQNRKAGVIKELHCANAENRSDMMNDSHSKHNIYRAHLKNAITLMGFCGAAHRDLTFTWTSCRSLPASGDEGIMVSRNSWYLFLNTDEA